MQPAENMPAAAYLTRDQLRRSEHGAKIALTFGVGVFAVHMVGWIKETWSPAAVFVAVAFVSALIVIFIVIPTVVTRSLKWASGNVQARPSHSGEVAQEVC